VSPFARSFQRAPGFSLHAPSTHSAPGELQSAHARGVAVVGGGGTSGARVGAADLTSGCLAIEGALAAPASGLPGLALSHAAKATSAVAARIRADS
jgi:hypothetical protein